VEQQFHYDSDLSGGSLMVRESRLVAQLLIEDVTAAQWDHALFIENILQKPTSNSARRNAITIRKRLELLTPDFWQLLIDADNELATQIAFCATLERNLLLIEFMETRLQDAYAARYEILDGYLWQEFLEERSHRDPAIMSWKESTKKKMGQTAYRILAEAGYLSKTSRRALQTVTVRPELQNLLNKHHKDRIRQCMQTSVCRPLAC